MAVGILRVGLTTPVGMQALPTYAAIRAGISRIREHAFDPLNEPSAPLGWLDDRYLPALHPDCAHIDERHARLVRLAAPALAEALAGIPQPVALLLAFPDLPDPGISDRAILAALAAQTGLALAPTSRVLRSGRAGGLLALELALAALAADPAARVCVGGIDSHMDSDTLTRLAAAGRLHGEFNRDGFIPGEAAAFVTLGRPRPAAARVLAVARANTTPLREGLALALRALLATPCPPIRHIYAGANGESLWAREWGVAAVRCSEHIATDARVDHPAEYIGDPGAALGPLLLGLAAIALARGHRPAPCLVWCGSDRGERAAALLDLPPERT